MGIVLSYCSERGDWEGGLVTCPAGCPGKHEHRAFEDDEAALMLALLLNVLRSTYDDLLDGDEAMGAMAAAYQEVTGQEIGY